MNIDERIAESLGYKKQHRPFGRDRTEFIYSPEELDAIDSIKQLLHDVLEYVKPGYKIGADDVAVARGWNKAHFHAEAKQKELGL